MKPVSDIENGADTKQTGYRTVADLMAQHDEFAIVRRFRALNMQNILYLQAEILNLEEELARIVERDTNHPDQPFHSKDWWSLAVGTEDGDQNQWNKILEIRKKLELYNDTVLKQAQLSRLDNPTKQDVGFLQSWFERPQMGNFPLLGVDRTAWDQPHINDLLSIRPRGCTDPLTRVMLKNLIPRYHHLIGERFKKPNPLEPGVYTYDERRIAAVVYSITTVTASILPICSVVVLYYVNSDDKRLGLTVLFCALFAVALVLVTKAKKVEVFAATAAFAAVNVVFLTNNMDCTCVIPNNTSNQTIGT